MGKKKKKHKEPANNIVPINRELFGMVSKEEMYDFSMYVVARNAARMLISEGVEPDLFEIAMQDEIKFMEAE